MAGSARKLPYRVVLLGLFGLVLAITCIRPASPTDLALEHIPTVGVVALLVFHGRKRPLSNLSYTLLFSFLLFHAVGAHYLYSNVPYQAWVRSLLGESASRLIATDRNHYDRIVHLAFGLLVVVPAAEIGGRFAMVKPGVWAAVFGVGVVSICANLYEALEWLLTLVASPEAAADYNGQQGDLFDASKDVALSLAGSVAPAVWVIVTRWPGQLQPWRSDSRANSASS